MSVFTEVNALSAYSFGFTLSGLFFLINSVNGVALVLKSKKKRL